jgi:hypothetical protein
MPTSRYLTRLVNLEPLDYHIVRRFANEKGLGGKGFSAALRLIIGEWYSIQSVKPSPKTNPQSQINNPQSSN